MATELQGGVVARDVSDGQIVEGLAVASSIRQTLRVPDRTALTAPGLVLQAGDSAYIISENSWLLYNGATWNEVYSDTGWVNVTLQTGWSQRGAVPISVRRVASQVQIRGRLDRGSTAGDIAFYLPEQFRSGSTLHTYYLRDSANNPRNVILDSSNGSILVSGASGAFQDMGLASIFYLVN